MNTPTRGIHHLTHPAITGPLVGAAGATAFVHINRVHTPAPWPTLLLLAWVAALAFCAYTTLVHTRTLPVLRPPRPRAGLVYVVSVAAMILGMMLAAKALTAMGLQDLQPAVVAALVGAHFVPFASAFHAPVFARSGAAMTTCGVAGIAAGLTIQPWCASASAAVAGLVWLIVMGVPALRDDA